MRTKLGLIFLSLCAGAYAQGVTGGTGGSAAPAGSANTVQKTNGSALAASSITDNGTTVSTPEPIQAPGVASNDVAHSSAVCLNSLTSGGPFCIGALDVGGTSVTLTPPPTYPANSVLMVGAAGACGTYAGGILAPSANCQPMSFTTTPPISISGNAATATALASTPTLCTAGQAPTGVLANGNATGCASAGSSGPTVTSSGLGYWCPVLDCYASGTGGAPVFVANQMRYQQFVLGAGTWRYGNFDAYVAIADSTSTASCGGAACGFMAAIYDSTCTLVAGTTMATNTGLGSAQKHQWAFASPGNLSAGVYFLGYTSDSTTVRFYEGDTTSLVVSMLNQSGAGKYRYFTGANAATGHNAGLTPPATCGTMTPITDSFSFDWFFVEP